MSYDVLLVHININFLWLKVCIISHELCFYMFLEMHDHTQQEWWRGFFLFEMVNIFQGDCGAASSAVWVCLYTFHRDFISYFKHHVLAHLSWRLFRALSAPRLFAHLWWRFKLHTALHVFVHTFVMGTFVDLLQLHVCLQTFHGDFVEHFQLHVSFIAQLFIHMNAAVIPQLSKGCPL
jgi:hypothetical protein